MREDLQQWRSKSNLCDGVNSKSSLGDGAQRENRQLEATEGGEDAVKVVMSRRQKCALF